MWSVFFLIQLSVPTAYCTDLLIVKYRKSEIKIIRIIFIDNSFSDQELPSYDSEQCEEEQRRQEGETKKKARQKTEGYTIFLHLIFSTN